MNHSNLLTVGERIMSESFILFYFFFTTSDCDGTTYKLVSIELMAVLQLCLISNHYKIYHRAVVEKMALRLTVN